MIFTVIPAKPFSESKTRLSSILSPGQRIWLSRVLLARTITVATHIGPVIVVSRSAAVRRLAKELGAYALVEGQAELNAAIRQGVAWGRAQGGSSALVLPLDLSRLSVGALERLIELGGAHVPGLVIAPCRRRRGTNALLLTPPAVISPTFGPNSFEKHRQLAAARGIWTKNFHAPELAFDLDTPADWREEEMRRFEIGRLK
ncbi:MAG: 2-phospho-L-lactate guanylyltransferase [Chloroflexota bacterium]